MARVAAHTPRTALVCDHDPDTGNPRATLCLLADDDAVYVPAHRPAEALAPLAAALDALHAAARTGSDRPAWCPAAVAALGYEGARAAVMPEASARDLRPLGDAFPAAWMASVVSARTLDRVTGAVRVHPASAANALEALCVRWGGAAPAAVGLGLALGDPAAHHAAVARVRAGIREGAVYLVNVARVLQRNAGLADDAIAEALAARFVDAAPPYGTLAHLGPARVCAMSMELGLRWDRTQGLAWSAPIKGTRPRDLHDPEHDRALAEALAQDPKERAENAMAVDVHRNDLGRVAVVGGVTMEALCAVEGHRFVHHLVSRVRARLPRDLDAGALLRAMFPVGSVTGAPKRAAMDFIAAVETHRRGLYTGALGAVAADGGFTWAVAIRTLVADAAGLHYGVGGGIVWDSEAQAEWDELAWKARAVTAG